jgi:hypothetical protein
MIQMMKLSKARAADQAAAKRLLAILKADKNRGKKVLRIKRSVLASRYENDLKLSIAVDRMLRELAG